MNRRAFLKLGAAVVAAATVPVPNVVEGVADDHARHLALHRGWLNEPIARAASTNRGAWRRVLEYEMAQLKDAFIPIDADPDAPHGTWFAT